MATRKTTPADRHGQPTPQVDISAQCDMRNHAKCRGIVVSLLAAPGTRCGCRCHLAQLPATWAATTTDRPPCELDDEEVAA